MTKPYTYNGPGPDKLVQVRTRVTEDTFDLLTGEAALRGMSMAALVRDLLTGFVGGASEGVSATPSTKPGSMTHAEREQFKKWQALASGGTPGAKWRFTVDEALRRRGVDLPSLPQAGDHDALIAWAHAVHPHTRASGTGTMPPRYVGA